jgi:disulfide oxidoreductase YuzD
MEKLYDDLLPAQAFLEHSLNILHDCLTPDGFNSAKQTFEKLESMLKAEQVEHKFITQVQKAKSILEKMKKEFNEHSNVLSKDYTQPLAEMRDILLNEQKEFAEIY